MGENKNKNLDSEKIGNALGKASKILGNLGKFLSTTSDILKEKDKIDKIS